LCLVKHRHKINNILEAKDENPPIILW